MKHANIIGLLNQPDSVKAPTEKMSGQIKFSMCLMKISASILLIFFKEPSSQGRLSLYAQKKGLSARQKC